MRANAQYGPGVYYWSLKGLKLYVVQCLSYSNNNTHQSSLPSLFFLALCLLISCPGAFIIGHLSSVEVVDCGDTN